MSVRLLLASAFVLLPVSLLAQDTTSRSNSPPFRRGQWAAQFQGGSSFGSLGFLKFRSPTRALVLDVRVSGGHSESLFTDSTGSHFSGLQSTADVQLRFGWRRYQGGAAKVVGHYSLGLLGGFTHNVSGTSFGALTENGWTAGVFGDVGGTYLLTPKFGIGALGTATISYANINGKTSPLNIKTRSWQLRGSALSASLVATLFF